jgi:hypothetical protein
MDVFDRIGTVHGKKTDFSRFGNHGVQHQRAGQDDRNPARFEKRVFAVEAAFDGTVCAPDNADELRHVFGSDRSALGAGVADADE